MTRRLVPKPHMLKSIRARNWSLAGAIQELVDNSAGHGRASTIRVLVSNSRGIVVDDNGSGIDNIDRIFTLGDASAYDDRAQIGQYGVGAKHATVYLGNLVTVTTHYKGRRHEMTVDWGKVERDNEWPEAYTGSGTPSSKKGTTIVIRKLATRHYPFSSVEKMVREFGQVFAPALRAGTAIEISHQLTDASEVRTVKVEPFTPSDLTKAITIRGSITTDDGVLAWSGRAGLSASLPESMNRVHIAFGHRVIEMTKDPFEGASAQSLYVEVELDNTGDWKHHLSEHKDKVVGHRDELMRGIHNAIADLLKESQQETKFLKLHGMTAPILEELNKVLHAAGDLFVDPDEIPEEGGREGMSTESHRGPASRLRTPTDHGDPAKPAQRPTGINIDWVEGNKLEGRAFSWSFSGKLMTIHLDADLHASIIDWPPSTRNKYLRQLIIAYFSHAVESEWWDTEGNLTGVLTPKLLRMISNWASMPSKVAPYLLRHLQAIAA